MKRTDSLVFRLTAMVFVLLAVTIAVILFLVNSQMDTHFTQYLQMAPRRGMGMGHHMMRGAAELQYVESIHRSLLWVGLGMTVISVGVSYIVVQKLVRPLLSLTDAVRSVQKGKFGQTVPNGWTKWAS